MCKAKANEFFYSAASERDCVRELQCLAPDGSPALSLVHADRLTPRISRRLPLQALPQLLTLGLERGMPSRPMLRVGPAIPPPTPTPAHGTHCPPFGRAAASAFGAISVPPDFLGPLPSVHSPLHLSDSAPLFSALHRGTKPCRDANMGIREILLEARAGDVMAGGGGRCGARAGRPTSASR